jgi:hypothetical protein
MTTTTQQYRVAKIVQDGQSYFPLVDNAGRIQPPDVLAELAAIRTEAPTRRFLALVADEGVPAEGPPLRLGIAPQGSVPLTYLESPFVLGHIEELSIMPANCLDDTVGECLVGIATMASTLLADIVWPAITSGRLRGLCVEVRGVEREDRFDVLDVLRVQLGARENDCLHAAHVVRCWEGDA